jgi:hypothetical protein
MPVRLLAALALLDLAACTDPKVGDGPITDLAFEENPANTLSVWATWTTPVPARSVVHFGQSSNSEYQVTDDTLTTDHRVLVYGLHELETYRGYAISESGDGATFTSAEGSFSAGALPYDWLRGEVVVEDTDRMEPGWTLCDLATGILTPTILVIVDADGEPVWYHIEGGEDGFPDIMASLVRDGVAFGPGVPIGGYPGVIGFSGERAWNGPQQPEETLSGRMHHVFTALPDDTFVIATGEITDGASADVVRIIDRDLDVRWRWSFAEHLNREDYGDRNEWTSVNSVSVDLDAGVAYINARWLDLLFAVSLADDSVLWKFGEGVDGDFSPDPAAAYPWFQGAHAVERLPDGDLLMYDNGDSMDPIYPDRGYSRAVEYHLDETTMESEIVWEYPGSFSTERWIASSWGDADRLDNGNTLIDLGDIDSIASPAGTPPARVIEVTASGDIVWDLRWDDADGIEGAYQVERIPVLIAPE